MQTADSSRTGGTGAHDSVGFVRFRLGGFPLALEAGHVDRVAPAPERTRLPGAPTPVVGLGSVAGHPTVLVSLADRLDVEPEGDERAVVVVRSGDGPSVGLLADGASGFLTAPAEAVIPRAESGDFFFEGTSENQLFRAVVTSEEGTAYVLSPGEVRALAGSRGERP
jgi:chemotaxis signal transduction protein